MNHLKRFLRKMKPIFLITLCCLQFFSAGANESRKQLRIYCAVLKSEEYMKDVLVYLDGPSASQEPISIRDYAHITQKEAFAACEKLSQTGDTAAVFALAYCYLYGAGTEKNLEKAFKLYWQLAKKGFAPALNSCGYCFSEGQGVEKNLEVAAYFFKKAADKNYPRGLVNLANTTYGADAIPPYQEKYAQLMKKAAAQHNVYPDIAALAFAELATFYGKTNYTLAVEYFEKAVAIKSYYYYDYKKFLEENKKYYPLFEVSRRAAEALAANREQRVRERLGLLPYYLEKAEKGDLYSIQSLYMLYSNSDGAELENKEEYYKWLTVAAEAGDGYGLTALGKAYCKGNWFEPDFAKGIRLQAQAVKQGYPYVSADTVETYGGVLGAENYIENVVSNTFIYMNKPYYHDFRGITPEEAFTFFYDLQKNPHPKFSENLVNQVLAFCYEKGRGVPADHTKALELGYNEEIEYTLPSDEEYQRNVEEYAQEKNEEYQKLLTAAKRGNAEAQYKLAHFFGLLPGDGTQKQLEAKVYWLTKAAEQNNKDALVSLGIMVQQGNAGGKADYSAAIQYFKKASQLGSGLASETLAECYLNGTGVAFDFDTAIDYYLLAFSQGNTGVKYRLKFFGISLMASSDSLLY